jgi:hypothetical protein
LKGLWKERWEVLALGLALAIAYPKPKVAEAHPADQPALAFGSRARIESV